MSLHVRIRPEAEMDIQSAYDWYESQAEGLGRRFVAGLDQAIGRICDYPELYSVVYRDVRVALLGKFPYLVCYLKHTKEIEVLAVIHAHRDPLAWKKRIVE